MRAFSVSASSSVPPERRRNSSMISAALTASPTFVYRRTSSPVSFWVALPS